MALTVAEFVYQAVGYTGSLVICHIVNKKDANKSDRRNMFQKSIV